MLRKILKWVSIVVGGLLALLVVFYTIAYFNSESRINRHYEVTLQKLLVPTDSLSYVRGQRIAVNRGCIGCHGSDLGGGTVFFDERSPLGILYAANITSGKGGVNFTDADWVRVLRHGLKKDNKPVWFMPSQDIYKISNQDLGDLLHYVKSQPPVDRVVPPHSIKPLWRVLVFLNKFPFPAELIDHNAVVPDSVQATVSASYGGYLATTCMGCHGNQLKGNPPHVPGEPPIPDISSTGEPGKWTAEGFVNVFHTGKTPEGKTLSAGMPWKDFKYSDDELRAILLYMQSVK